jgi:hypothetical protein
VIDSIRVSGGDRLDGYRPVTAPIQGCNPVHLEVLVDTIGVDRTIS